MNTKIVYGDDWVGFYINNKLILEGHELRVEDVLEKLYVPVEVFDCDYNWLEERGYFPEDFSEVILE